MIICKYVFDNTVEANYVPTFNSGFTYEITDTYNGDGTTTRVINSIEVPSLIRFGHLYDDSASEDTIYDSASLLNVSYLDISNITSMHSMFAYCINLRTINTTGWNTSNITSMHDLFLNCKSLTSLDLSNWDTSNVNDMGSMFYNCQSLTSLDLSNWNTENVSHMNTIFGGCNSLKSLDLSNWDTSNVIAMQSMFYNCTALTSLNVSNWNIDSEVLTNYSAMLSGANALKVINLSYASEDTVTVFLGSVPSQALTVKTTPENVAYATDTAPSNVTVIDVIAIMNINTTKQQLLYSILYGIQNANIIPQTKEELILYGIMMGQAVNILPSSIKQELLLHISKGTKNANIIPHDTEELILYGIMMNQDVDVRLDTIVQILYYTILKKGV